MGSFSSPTQQSVNYFYANRYLFQLDDIFYAGLAYVLIFAMIYLIGRVIGIFMHLVPQPEKLEDRKYQIGAGVIAVVITFLVIQMGLTVLSTVPMASIQNRLNASGLIRFIILHTPDQFQSVPQLVGDCDYRSLRSKMKKGGDKSDSRKDAHFFVGET